MNHNKSCGSCLGCTEWASHSLGPPSCFSFPHYSVVYAWTGPHPFGKGRGCCRCILASEASWGELVRPTSLKRGETTTHLTAPTHSQWLTSNCIHLSPPQGCGQIFLGGYKTHRPFLQNVPLSWGYVGLTTPLWSSNDDDEDLDPKG